jgi:dihydrolipoamide dehydrogenase
LIAEGVLAIEMGANATDLGLTIHPHPTLSETLMEAADAMHGNATSIYRPRKRPKNRDAGPMEKAQSEKEDEDR